MLDIYPGKKAKFVKNYMKAAAGSIQDAVALYIEEVRAGKFPGKEQSF
jgi:3-methyl-2-oxobutanoate hydroxymethyltransferase